MKAMFTSVKEFAVFNCKPHLFTCGQPFQIGETCAESSVYVELVAGSEVEFSARVQQFGGVVLRDYD